MKKQIFCFEAILTILVFLISCNPTEPENKPELLVNLTSCTFTKNVNTETLVISNVGSAELSWEILGEPVWLEVSKSSGKVTTGNDTVIVTANINQEAGEYSGTISITSNGGNKEIGISLDISIWVMKKKMPTARVGHYSCVLDGNIYVIGGSNTREDLAFKTLEVYDPLQNTWMTKANMIERRANFAVYILSGKIYAVGGGQRFFWVPQETIEEYDPVTDTWTYKTNMPRARMGHTASLVNGKIYIIGGAAGSEISFAVVDVYDPLTNTWTTAADLPTPRFNLAAVVLNEKIYAIGGHIKNYQNWIGLSTVEEYNPATDTWTTKANMITGRKYFTASALNGKIYVFGGSPGHLGYFLSSVEEYDPSTDTWIEKTDIPTSELVGASAVSYEDKIYISGGAFNPIAPTTVVSTMYEYEPGIDP